MLTKPGDTIIIGYQSEIGDTTIYPQAKIYDSSDTLLDTVNLAHKQSGAYVGTTTAPSNEGHYYIQIIPYNDAGHTTQSGVDAIKSDGLDVRFNKGGGGGGGDASFGAGINVEKDLKPIIEKLDKLSTAVSQLSTFDAKKDAVITQEKIIDPASIIPMINKIVVANKSKEYDTQFRSLVSEVKKLENKIESIQLPQYDFSAVESQLKDVLVAVKNAEEIIVSSFVEKIDSLDLSFDFSSIVESLPQDRSSEVIDIVSKKIDELKVIARSSTIDQDTIRRYILAAKDDVVKSVDKMIKNLDSVDTKRDEIILKSVKKMFDQIQNLLNAVDENVRLEVSESIQMIGSYLLPKYNDIA